MIFSQDKDFDDSEIELAKGLLEKLIGKDKQFCRKRVEKNGFLYLDHWNDKMGFVKEDQNRYLILSLQFEDNECNFYQVIIKESNKKWLEGRILDYNIVRELGILEETRNSTS